MSIEMDVLKLLALAQEKMAVVPDGLDIQFKILKICQDINDLIEKNKKEFDRKQWLTEHKFECPYCGSRYASKDDAEEHKSLADKSRLEDYASYQDKIHPRPKPPKVLPIIEHKTRHYGENKQ